MHRIPTVIALMVLLGVMYGCTNTVKCDSYNTGVSISFRGFDSNDLRQVIITEFSKTGVFSNVLSRDTFGYASNGYRSDIYDTVHGYVDWAPSLTMREDYDYQVDVIATGSRYRISGITSTHDDEKLPWGTVANGGNMCHNVVTEYYVNGTRFVTGLSSSQSSSGYGVSATLQR